MPNPDDAKNVIAYRHDRKWQKERDQEEKTIRSAARHHRCYQCVLAGRGNKTATDGQLCKECFDATDIPEPGVVPM